MASSSRSTSTTTIASRSSRGQRGGERRLILHTPSANGGTWTRRVLDEGGMAGAVRAAVDLNADRRTTLCIGSATANLEGTKTLGNAGRTGSLVCSAPRQDAFPAKTRTTPAGVNG
jgi:hypothetical protein